MKRVVFISGSSRGIGYYIAKKFLSNGDRVILNGTNKKNLLKSYYKLSKVFKKKYILPLCGDIKKKSFLIKARREINKKFKGIDVIIANAGRVRLNGEILTNKKFFDYNYNPAFAFTNFFKKDLTQSNNGSIILISSAATLTKTSAPKGFIDAKSCINRLGKKLALELSKKNVNVNVVAPGNVYIKNGNWEIKMKKNKKKVIKYIKKNVPMNRFVYPEEVANLCLFLSDIRSKFITGQIISVDGGQSIKI